MLPQLQMNPLYKLDLQAYYGCKILKKKKKKMMHAGLSRMTAASFPASLHKFCLGSG